MVLLRLAYGTSNDELGRQAWHCWSGNLWSEVPSETLIPPIHTETLDGAYLAWVYERHVRVVSTIWYKEGADYRKQRWVSVYDPVAGLLPALPLPVRDVLFTVCDGRTLHTDGVLADLDRLNKEGRRLAVMVLLQLFEGYGFADPYQTNAYTLGLKCIDHLRHCPEFLRVPWTAAIGPHLKRGAEGALPAPDLQQP